MSERGRKRALPGTGQQPREDTAIRKNSIRSRPFVQHRLRSHFLHDRDMPGARISPNRYSVGPHRVCSRAACGTAERRGSSYRSGPRRSSRLARPFKVPSNHKLFVFLPGTGAPPAFYQLVQMEAAHLGYHVIGLMYMNDTPLAGVCPQSPDPETCYEQVRLQIITGSPQTGVVEVNQVNSIDNRLRGLRFSIWRPVTPARVGRNFSITACLCGRSSRWAVTRRAPGTPP